VRRRWLLVSGGLFHLVARVVAKPLDDVGDGLDGRPVRVLVLVAAVGGEEAAEPAPARGLRLVLLAPPLLLLALLRGRLLLGLAPPLVLGALLLRDPLLGLAAALRLEGGRRVTLALLLIRLGLEALVLRALLREDLLLGRTPLCVLAGSRLVTLALLGFLLGPAALVLGALLRSRLLLLPAASRVPA
jgi:hypothetical protein